MNRDTFWQSHASGFYFRVRGWGLAIDRDLPRLFSERMGFRRVLRIGKWAIQVVRP